MYPKPAPNWFHSGRVSTAEFCENCGRILRHEKWCITRAPLVQYAYAVVNEPEKLTLRDRLILHALGVDWGSAPHLEKFEQLAKV